MVLTTTNSIAIPNSPIFVIAQYPTDLESGKFVGDNGCAAFCVPNPSGWMILGRFLDEVIAGPGCDLNVLLSLEAWGDLSDITTVSLYLEDDHTELRFIKSFDINGEPDSVFSGISRRFFGGVLERSDDVNLSGRLFAAIEVSRARNLRKILVTCNFSCIQEFRRDYLDLSTLMREETSRTDRNGLFFHQNSSAYQNLRMAEIAMQHDCFSLAEDLISKIHPKKFSSINLARRLLKVNAEVLVAKGETEKLKEILLENLNLVRSDDKLFTSLSICAELDDRSLPIFGKLPSAKLNRYFISRFNCGAFSLAPYLGANERSDDIADTMLYASDTRLDDADKYERYWRALMAFYKLARPSFEKPVDGTNILKSFRFERLPAVSGSRKVSIIMSAFNAEATISYAIHSIERQTYQNWELLICDDGSTDSTEEVISAYRSHDKIRLFKSRTKQGPYNVRNELLERARGELIAFQDADDLAHPQRMELQVSSITHKTPFSMGKWIRIRPDGRIVFFRDQHFLRYCVVSLMAPKLLLQNLGIYRNVMCGGDSEMYEILMDRFGVNSINYLDAPLIIGLWSDRSLTRTGGIELTEDGYRSPARRAYAELCARQRVLGRESVTDGLIDRVNLENGIYCEKSALEEI